MIDRLYDYGHKLRILRQIQSNKAKKFSIINNTQNIVSVVVSALLTFLGFSGTEKVAKYFNWAHLNITKDQVDLWFNLLVFVLFVLVVLHLVFRFQDKQTKSENAMVSLTALINEIDDHLFLSDAGEAITKEALKDTRQKYEILTQIIPPSSDKEFLKAKEDFEKKKARSSKAQEIGISYFDQSIQFEVIHSMVSNSRVTMQILAAMQKIDSNLYLTGSVFRGLVWDSLHKYKNPTPFDDVDVIYFNPTCIEKVHDKEIEERLKGLIANYRWSVKNQARMHTFNNDAEYQSIEDAVSKFPETASAFAIKLDAYGKIEIIAPHKFDDLLRLLVRPTPHFSSKLPEYRARLKAKKWQDVWPHLIIIEK